ncbi:hypothetical protein HGRIS_008415 [Hohenbuehelia grisea]|uniref:Uncharacterized protein n=1 Tax=Hohenbuehelia grisea TaxID=104357 RepID=A0ABR3J8E5_9AGAR
MPLLWSSLSVKVTPTATSPSLPLVHLWLDRSGSCPLSLALTHDDEENWADDGSDVAAQVLEFFAVYWRRWRHYRICLPDPCPGYPITMLPEAGPPLLKSLCLQIGGDLTADEVEVVAANITSAPSLSHLTWGHFYYDLDEKDVPWSQLTYLRLDCDVPVQAACRLLQLCTNLATWHIDGISTERERTPGPVLPERAPLHVHQTALRTLSVRASLAPFFNRLTLPGLRELSVVSDDSVPIRGAAASSNAQHLLAFLTRSRCPLDTLALDIAGFDADALIACLHVLSASLVTLDVQNDTGLLFSVDAVVAALARPGFAPGAAHVCPALARITFGPGIAATRTLVDAMIASRAESRDAGAGRLVVDFTAA